MTFVTVKLLRERLDWFQQDGKARGISGGDTLQGLDFQRYKAMTC